MIDEKWKSLKEYPLYEVSSYGRVRRIGSPKVLLQSRTRHGYLQVSLYDGHGNVKHCRVNRLVGLTFMLEDRKDINDEIHHIDRDKTNNSINNLIWVSHRDNCIMTANTRPVSACSHDKVVAKFSSIREAAKQYNCSATTIRNHIRKGTPYKDITFSDYEQN